MSARVWIVIAIVVSIPVVFYFVNRAVSGKANTVGKKIAPSNLVSIDSIEHQPWNQLLSQFVNQKGRVDYREWWKDNQARKKLNAYLELLSTANPDALASKENRLAFWINAYNALTVYGILEEYPTDSIRNHTSRIGGYNLWHDLKILVGNQEYSLHEIEHEILRKMDEPRIHFAIVCASTSCPRLLNEAYVGKKLEAQLATNARDFLANENNFRFDEKEDVVYLSSIFKWFNSDFGENKIELFGAIQPYLKQSIARKLTADTEIKYLEYDWSLNGQ